MKTDNLTKQEAEQAMREGETVFQIDTPNNFLFIENKCIKSKFFHDSIGVQVNSELWNSYPETGWRIYLPATINAFTGDTRPLVPMPEAAQHTPLLCVTEEPVHEQFLIHAIGADKPLAFINYMKNRGTNDYASKKEYALLIVKAVNNHDALKVLVKKLYDLCELTAMKVHSDEYDEAFRNVYNPVMNEAESALNKVEQ